LLQHSLELRPGGRGDSAKNSKNRKSENDCLGDKNKVQA
jgi:hypothetical protein